MIDAGKKGAVRIRGAQLPLPAQHLIRSEPPPVFCGIGQFPVAVRQLDPVHNQFEARRRAGIVRLKPRQHGLVRGIAADEESPLAKGPAGFRKR